VAGAFEPLRQALNKSQAQNTLIHPLDIRPPAKRHGQVQLLVDDLQRFGHALLAHGAQGNRLEHVLTGAGLMGSYMLYDRTYMQEYLARLVRPKSRTLERSLLAVLDALSSGTEVSREDLDATAQGASDKRQNICHVSTEVLGLIAERTKEQRC